MRSTRARRRLVAALASTLAISALVATEAGAVSGDNTITTVAGVGSGGFNGDGLPGTSTRLNNPQGLAFGPGGTLYISDTSNHRIRTLDASGLVATIAGVGTAGFSGDGAAATAAQLNLPRQVAVHTDGTVYVADRNNHRIRRIDAGGTIQTAAGTGSNGASFDGPVGSVAISVPWGVAVLPDGRPVFSNQNRHRIRTVGNGLVLTLAGNGSGGFTGDGQATSQRIWNPMGVTTTADGTFYFADYSSRRIRKVDSDGNLVTLAGTGPVGYTGDGGPATLATFRNPRDVAVDRAGNVYIADQSNHAVRKIDRDGMISTILGGLGAGFTGDGGMASLARSNNPISLAIGPDGSLYIGSNDDRVRKIENKVPAAVLSSDVTSGPEPLTVAFTGVGSTDDDGGIISYAWDFGDGTTSTDVAPNHTFSSAGTYTVTLTVMDDSGAEVTASTTITAAPVSSTAPSTPLTPNLANARCHGQKPTIVGTNGHDVIIGTPGADVIVAGPGDDVVRGLGGNDRICLGTGADRGIGGPGGDVIHGGTGPDRIVGGPGADGLAGGKGNDQLHGHAGGDTILGGDGQDILSGGVGRDLIRGGGGNDRAVGGPGPDRIFGGSSNDVLFGTVGNDLLIGQEGRDAAHGGQGSDSCKAEIETGC